jgi:hypothetical protein
MTTTPMDGTTEVCVASLKNACKENNKRWRPFLDASYRCIELHSDSAKRLVLMYLIMDM